MLKKYKNYVAEAWYYDLLENMDMFPFRFTYRGIEHQGFSVEKFELLSQKNMSQRGKEISEQIWILDNELKITLNFVYYPSYGVSEWTVWFENISCRDSGILEKAESVLTFAGSRPVLKGILGDEVNQYHPYCQDLADMDMHFVSNSGRATHINFPYFNLEYGDGGVMLAIGWAGSWTADFSYDGQVTTYTANAINGLKTYLKPGEKLEQHCLYGHLIILEMKIMLQIFGVVGL